MARFPARAAVLAALAACAPAAAQAPAPPPRPTLVVLITVDQLIPEYFERFGPQLTGGLARLRRDGAYYPNGFQDHAITETAPGHASIGSGRFPRSHGIVMNAAGVGDPQAPLLGGQGSPASPFRFRGTALADWMRVADPASRALSVSRKDRGAILPLGRSGQPAFWYVPHTGAFSTSTWYADTLPSWVRRFNDRRLPQSKAGATWDLLLPASAYPETDDIAVESGGKNRTFPHVVHADPDSAAWTAADFPFMDEMIAALALEGVREMELGAGPAPDLLAVSFSTMDAVGHRYGRHSREVHDQVLRLDRTLGMFLDSLFRLRDPARVVIALSADHGVSHFPEVVPGGAAAAAYYVETEEVYLRHRDALVRRGVDSTAFAWDDGMLYVDRAAFARAGVDADRAVDAFATALRAVPGMMRVDRLAALRARGDTADAITRRWVHMVPAELPVELVATLLPGRVWGRRTYAQHGSPHDDDARVPILFHGAPFAARTHARPARVVDIAPTLAHVLGVPPLETIDGRVLTDALR